MPAASSSSSSAAKSGRKLTREQAHRKASNKSAKLRKAQLDSIGAQATAKQRTLKQINRKAEKVSTKFKYASFNQRLQDVHLAPAAISTSSSYRPYSGLEGPLAPPSSTVVSEQDHIQVDDDAVDPSLHAKTAFSQALETWTDLNLSDAFQSLHSQLRNVCQSLPQLIHHRATIAQALSLCLSRPDQWLAWDAALDLLPRLARELGSEFLPIYSELLRSAIHVTTTTKATTGGDERAAALLVERGFQSAAWILKAVSPLIVSKQSVAKETDADAMEIEADAGDEQPSIDTHEVEVEVDERTQRLVQTWLVIRPYLGWRPLAAPSNDNQRDTADHGSEADDNGDEDDEEDDADEDEDQGSEAEVSDRPGIAQPASTFDTASAAFVNTKTQRLSPFTRRFASEAFAHLLRKTRGQQLQSIVTLILQDLRVMLTEEDAHPRFRSQPSRRPSVRFSRGIAGIWVEGCKSLDRRLHSKCLPLLSVLFRPESHDGTGKHTVVSSVEADHAHLTRLIVGRLTLTALVHHCNAVHFAPVLELVMDVVDSRRLEIRPDASNGAQSKDAVSRQRDELARLTESVEWLATAVGVRKGSRVSDAAKSGLFGLLLRLCPLFLDSTVQEASGAALRTSLVTLFSLCLPIGRIQDLIGPGIKLIESVAPVPSATAKQESIVRRQPLWPEFCGLVEALADPTLEWDGFKQFVLPAVLTSTAETVQCDAVSPQSKDQAMSLLERLAKLGQLEHVRASTPSPSLVRWSNLISSEIETRLEALVKLCGTCKSKGVDKVLSRSSALEPLVPALRLATVPRTDNASRFASLLTELITESLLTEAVLSSAHEAKRLYNNFILNPLLLLSLAFTSLATLEARDRRKDSKIATTLFTGTDTVSRVIRCASWHSGAMAGLSKLLAVCKGRVKLQVPSLEEVYEPMVSAVMAADPTIRLAALELVQLMEPAAKSAKSDTESLLSKLVEVEQTPLAVSSVRDRNVRMRAAGRDFAKAVATYKAADAERNRFRDALVLRYILASYKINLRPIWSESTKALVDIISSGNNSINAKLMEAAIAEIEAGQELQEAELRSIPASWTQTSAAESSRNGLVDADEIEPDRILRNDAETADLDNDKQFQDPILLAKRQAARTCIEHARISGGGFSNRASTAALSTTLSDSIDLQRPDARLDLANHRLQILKLFAEIPTQLERHIGNDFVSVFFRDAGPRMTSGVALSPLDEEDDDDTTDDKHLNGTGADVDSKKMQLGRRDRQSQLSAYLEVFAKLKSPTKLERSDDLYVYFLQLCATADVATQKRALDAVLSWKEEAIAPYATKLKDLLEAATFRDVLMNFVLSSDSDVIQPYHRPTLMPLVVRLLFGALLSRRGNRTSGAGQKSRRGAVLSALAEIDSRELVTLVDLMLAPFEDQSSSTRTTGEAFSFSAKPPLASLRRQTGYLTLLSDVVKQIGANLLPYWDRLVSVTLNLTYHAHRSIEQMHVDDDAISGVEPQSSSISARTSRARAVRQAGYKRICDFFSRPQAATLFAWESFLPAIVSELVSPRLDELRMSASQDPSALMSLLHTWSSHPETLRLLGVHDNRVLPSLFAGLSTHGAKSSAVSHIFDIEERVLAAAAVETKAGPSSIPHLTDDAPSADISIVGLLVKPHASAFLNDVAPFVEQSLPVPGGPKPSAERIALLRRAVSLLASLSPYVSQPEDANRLVRTLIPLMSMSNFFVPERTKAELLSIFERLLTLTPEFQDANSALFEQTYAMFSGLFSSLRSSDARKSLSAAFLRFADIKPSLTRVGGWCQQLNAMSRRRVEERDFDKMFTAFDTINAEETTITPDEWMPLVHNMLFFLLDPEELSIRGNASASLVKFVAQTAEESNGGAKIDSKLVQLFTSDVWPGLKRSIRNKAELVRKDVLTVIAAAAESLVEGPIMSEFSGLLADGDVEASFFTNIHHIQLHRRLRAVRRLAEQVATGGMKSETIADFLAPLMGHFLVTGSVDLNDHNLVNEVITTLGKLAGHMDWNAYNSLLWRYLRLANESKPTDDEKKSTSERVMVRAAIAILDNFHFAMDESTTVQGEPAIVEQDDEQEEDEDASAEDDVQALQKDFDEARRVRILDAVTGKLLPRLMSYLEQKDETEDSTRLPIAIGVVRVAQCLPTAQRKLQLSKLLRTVANIFRSKSQETRNLARETICKVMASLGPSWLPELLTELRRSLVRGPQKAVLAFTVHSVLVHLMDSKDAPLTSLDKGAKDIVEIAVEDVFGDTAEDRDSIGNKTTYIEVKRSKSMDTFEQVAKVVEPSRMADVLQPLRDILQQTEVPTTVRQVEESLHRIASGIAANPQFDSSRFLVLCATLIRRDAGYLQARKPEPRAASSKNRSGSLYRYAVFLKRKDVEEGSSKDHYSRNAHKFVAFGLEMLVASLRKERFDFQDEAVLAKLNSMVDLVGETTYANESSVLELSLRAIAQIVKVPVNRVDKALPVFVKQIFTVIHQYGSPQSQIVQTAFRTLTAILRQCKQASLSETHLSGLLKLIGPDLEEPAVQSTLFGLLRAVVSRRFVVPEVYDTMDKVAEMMVTNQSHSVRDVCRSTYLQFLLDYPQGKARLRNQIGFLAKNLAYEHESGRLSVLEITEAIFDKFADELLQDYAEMLFVALAMMLANDGSPKCRERAAGLISSLVRIMSEAQQTKMIEMVGAWARTEGKAELARVGVQIYGLVLEALPDRSNEWAGEALEIMTKVLVDCADDLEALETSGVEGIELDWQLPYHSLQALGRLGDPASAVEALDAVRRLLLFPHNWVRTSSSRLLGSIYAAREPAAPTMITIEKDPVGSLPALVDAAKKMSLQLRSENLNDTLALQTVKNLVWVGRSLALFPVERKAVDESAIRDIETGSSKKAKTSLEAVDDEEDETGEEDKEGADQEASDDDESVIEGAADREAEMDSATLIAADPLKWLVGRLSFQARLCLAQSKRSNWTIQPSSILRFFAALASSVDAELVVQMLGLFLSPIIRIAEGAAVDDELKALAIEVQELIQGLVPLSIFNSTYSQLKRRQETKRQERKTQRLMRGIQNPEAEAARKARINTKKHQARKRRNEEHIRNRKVEGGRNKRARKE
ncbi:hypothetical protein BCV70DRAFT_175634 [Testicularia cyperi]|uniref:Uncharacterized protein n=1 Tax=Testicularia cyperi TaxID=1882483 RepID=A0A317XQJ1_9BASI|nr:hypothetical protein BCV70DRAFT_175634 [Testicularia cyperi]